MMKIKSKIHIGTIVLFLLIGNHLYSQKVPGKDTIFILHSIPAYDSLGNEYNFADTLNHTPTYLDSIAFIKRINDFFLNKQEKKK